MGFLCNRVLSNKFIRVISLYILKETQVNKNE